eukprot:2704627-Prymnesium_polylepis.1
MARPSAGVVGLAAGARPRARDRPHDVPASRPCDDRHDGAAHTDGRARAAPRLGAAPRVRVARRWRDAAGVRVAAGDGPPSHRAGPGRVQRTRDACAGSGDEEAPYTRAPDRRGAC